MSADRPPARGARRDFGAELRHVECWDRSTERVFEAEGEPLQDRVLQGRDELIGLCELIEARRVRSYLEIGIWTGQLLCTLQRLFRFDLVAACDHGWAQRLGLPLHLPAAARLFCGDSGSAAFELWRARLGHVDLVLIDANHGYGAVKRDFSINRRFPHRYIALHDITGARRQTAGVGRLWRELVAAGEGHTREIVRPHTELGLAHSIMGIGVWSATDPP